jgi:pimeloyl-ACP methyl ester carboxylesterase/DNA-binding CsgD family transcriptional regulator
MGKNEEPAPEATLQDEVIDRLYEVAVDPSRYEALLDHWEKMIQPQRAAANTGKIPHAAPALGLKQFEGHFQRADQVLDRAIAAAADNRDMPVVAQIDRVAAFAVNRSLVLTEINAAAARVFGVTPGARVADLALAEGEGDQIGSQIARLFNSNMPGTVLLRTRAALTDRLILLHLRLIQPSRGTPQVIAISTELVWPEGFTEMLRSAFDLTPAEAEVMQALAEGQSLSDIAAVRARSIETVRAQLKAIMAKTETRSQSELVRLTLSTMDLVWYSTDATHGLPAASRGFNTLEQRPFNTMRLRDGRRMDYLILGDPEGRPVLFFPLDYGLVRWPATAEAEAARRGLRIIVPVRAGFGASTPLAKGVPYVAQLAEDMAALLDHLGVNRAPLMTLGGDSYIGFAFHAAYPERMTAMICSAGLLPLTRSAQYERMDKWHRFILAGARYTPHLLPFMVKAGFALARRLGKRGFIHAVYGNSRADLATFEIDEVYEAMVCGSEVALSDTHSAHDAFAREVICHETTDWSDEVDALRRSGRAVYFLNGLQDPQVPPATLDEFRQDYPWIDFRVYPDAGQLVFFLKWRDALEIVQRHVD